MRRTAMVAIFGAFTPLILGQMCGAPSPVNEEPQFGRLDITPDIRKHCDGLTDQEIQEMILLTEEARMLGLTYEYQLATSRVGCTTGWCEQCAATMIAQIYER